MNFVWAGVREQFNTQVNFYIRLQKPCDCLRLCAADSFRVFADGELISYGPCRTAAGYSRIKTVELVGVKELLISVTAYNTPCFACDFQLPFFGAELLFKGKTTYFTGDFSAFIDERKIRNVPRFSIQRGYVEYYDFIKGKQIPAKVYAVESPQIIEEKEEVCGYKIARPQFHKDFSNKKFDEIKTPWWYAEDRYKTPNCVLDIKKHVAERIDKEQFLCKQYVFEKEHTGILQLKLKASAETELFIVFEEVCPNGKWIFRRSECNDVILLKIPQGETTFTSAEPYAFKYVRVYSNIQVQTDVSLILIQNDKADCVSLDGKKELVDIFNAAKNSFCQNSVDIFMDCPGRERAGWLCDSFFTAKAERLFTGENKTEKVFLENFLLSKTPEIPPKMLPMCFPSEHLENQYIPNWAMWFIVELQDYLDRTGDREFIERAKDRVYQILDFFEKYENEYMLLEDLESWVFIEWSVCNSKEYTKGVNFPSNMLYAKAMEIVAQLYGDKRFEEKAQTIKRVIKEHSFNGQFFVDNAVRDENNSLISQQAHISETCQYYALFSGLDCDEAYKEKIKNEFGPSRGNKYSEIGASNMFIGNYLRLYWLLQEGEYDKVVEDIELYFYEMAKQTGTLWEHNQATASCNHGFTSVVAVYLLEAAFGYKGVKNGKAIYDKKLNGNNSYNLAVSFNYTNNNL